jgi:hypothetical protein
MRLSIERSGGVAGMIRRAAVDEADLPPAAAKRFRTLMTAVDFAGLSRAMPAKGEPDRFVYSLTAEFDGKTYTVRIGEAAVPEPLANCLQFAFDQAQG